MRVRSNYSVIAILAASVAMPLTAACVAENVDPDVNNAVDVCVSNGGGSCDQDGVDDDTASAEQVGKYPPGSPVVDVPIVDLPAGAPKELSSLTYPRPENLAPPPPSVADILTRAQEYHDLVGNDGVDALWDNRPDDALVNVYLSYGTSSLPYYAAGLLGTPRENETLEQMATRFVTTHWHTSGFCDAESSTPNFDESANQPAFCPDVLEPSTELVWTRREYEWGGTVTELTALQRDAAGTLFSPAGLTLTFHGNTLTSVSGLYYGPLDSVAFDFASSDEAAQTAAAKWLELNPGYNAIRVHLASQMLLMLPDGSELIPTYEFELRSRPAEAQFGGGGDDDGDDDDDGDEPREPVPPTRLVKLLVSASMESPGAIMAEGEAMLEDKYKRGSFSQTQSALTGAVGAVSARAGALGAVFPDVSVNRTNWNDRPREHDRLFYTLLEEANSHVLEAGAGDAGQSWQARSLARPGYLDGPYLSVFAAHDEAFLSDGRTRQNCFGNYQTSADGCWQVVATNEKFGDLPVYAPYQWPTGPGGRPDVASPPVPRTNPLFPLLSPVISSTSSEWPFFAKSADEIYVLQPPGAPVDPRAEKTNSPLFSSTIYFWVDRLFRYHIDPYTRRDLNGADIPLEDKLVVLVNGGGDRKYPFEERGGALGPARDGGEEVCGQGGSCARAPISDAATGVSSFEAAVHQAFAISRPDGLFGPRRGSGETANNSGYHMRPKVYLKNASSYLDPDAAGGGGTLGVVYHETMHFVNRVAMGRFRRLSGWRDYAEARGLDEGLAYAYASLVLDDPIDFAPVPTAPAGSPQDKRWIHYNDVMGACPSPSAWAVKSDSSRRDFFTFMVPGILGAVPELGCCAYEGESTGYVLDLGAAPFRDFFQLPWSCLPRVRYTGAGASWGLGPSGSGNSTDSLRHGLSGAASDYVVTEMDIALSADYEKDRFKALLDFDGTYVPPAGSIPDADFPTCGVRRVLRDGRVQFAGGLLDFSGVPGAAASDFDSVGQCGSDSGSLYLIGDLVSQVIWELTHAPTRAKRPCQDGRFRQALLEAISQMHIDSTLPQFFTVLEYQLHLHGWTRDACDVTVTEARASGKNLDALFPAFGIDTRTASTKWARARMTARGVWQAPATSLCGARTACTIPPNVRWPIFKLPPVASAAP